jgi:hypothetical protein
MATTRAILQHFENWEKAQFDFLECVAELIVKPLVRQLSSSPQYYFAFSWQLPFTLSFNGLCLATASHKEQRQSELQSFHANGRNS